MRKIKTVTIDSTVLLNQAFKHFVYMTSWLPSHCHNAVEGETQAKALIELVEVSLHGSVGFYSDGRVVPVTGYQLFDRFLALADELSVGITPCCNFNLSKLSKYFHTLYRLRNESLRSVT